MKKLHKLSLLAMLTLTLSSCNNSEFLSILSSFLNDSDVTSSSSDADTSISGEGGNTSTSSGTGTSSKGTSSSSSSSSGTITAEGTITFDMNENSSNIAYEINNIPVDQIDGTSCNGASERSIRIGTRNSSGQLEITFSEEVMVKGLKIDASPYAFDSNPVLSVRTSAHSSAVSKTISSHNTYVFNEFESDSAASTSITLSTTTKAKRVCVYSITVVMGDVHPVYPTSISATSSLEVGLGSSKPITVTLSPWNTNVKELSYSSANTNIATVNSKGVVTGVALGNTTVTVTATAANGVLTATTAVEVVEAPTLAKTPMAYTYKDYVSNNVYDLDNCPTTGSAKILVIPVWFSDSSSYINANNKASVREDIRKAYFGTQTETGWHSVKTYYEAESMGRLTLEGTVSDWYNVNSNMSTYGSVNSGANATMSLVESASDWYFTNNPSESRKDYDRDGNGYLDGVMLIYAAPDYYAMNRSSYGNLWAYCYWMQDTSKKSTTNPGANVYFWASYDFMYGSNAYSRTGQSSYASGDTSHCTIDAHTFIHEMGHVFGLEDYYDYGSYQYSPAAGFSMQDHNVGGHDPYSVMAYGWADPYIPTSSCTIEIGAFQSTHDVVLLTPSWNSVDSPFDEYLLVELFTPTGLNAQDCSFKYADDVKGPSATGIRLWHVDARLVAVNSVSSRGEPNYSSSNITVNPTQGTYGVYHAMSNSYNSSDYGSILGSNYYRYNLVEVIRNSTTMSTGSTDTLSADDLFYSGDTFNMSKYAKQFANSGKLNSNVDLGWSFSVTIDGSGENAVATLQLIHA